MLSHRLDLKFLAPILLVSVILIAACLLGVLYLNSVHVNASAVLSENVRSATAAARLEATCKDLLSLLRNRRLRGPVTVDQVRSQNATLRELLSDAQGLANLEHESDLIRQISRGLNDYLAGWDRRASVSRSDLQEYDEQLADVLERQVLDACVDLRKFNMDEVARSDRANLTLVQTLQWGLLGVAVIAPVSGLMLGYSLAQRLHRSIRELSVHIRDAAGQLNRELGKVTVADDGDFPSLQTQMHGLLTEVTRVVDQLQQREHEVLRAEQLAAVGQVAAGVAHEIRNPLTAVKMLIQTAREAAPAGPGGGLAPGGLAADDLPIIEQEIRRMEHCLQMFLDFARPPRSERRRSDVRDVVRRATQLVEGRARRQDVSVRTDLPEHPVALMLDPEQLNQVLVNLLLNALDVLPGGGSIGVRLRADGEHVDLSVADTGPGIPAAVADRLFEPFVSTKESGLGLGLSICRRLVEAHGGTIRGANAETGAGAVFTVRLPARQLAAA